jgi:protein-S-isoprenylcysteine O-methyltransferase Ste14
MNQWQSRLAVTVIAAVAFVLIRSSLYVSGLDRLFHEQIPVHTPGRSLTLLALVAPFAVILLASLLTSAIARTSTAVAYGVSWLVYASLLSQALLSMSGAFLLILPLMIPLNAMTGWLHPNKWCLPVHYTSAQEPVVLGLISVGLALIVVGIVDLLRARRHNRLATNGLYTSLRHPQHLGIILWTLGFALWGASPIDLVVWFIVSYVFVCLGMHEEGKLT